MLLDARERVKFLAWCREQADTCRQLADNLNKLDMFPARTTLVAREQQKATAFAIVAMELEANVETYVVTAEDTGSITPAQE